MSVTTTTILKADGDAGARRAGALLAIALCAETSQTSLSEDSAKVDLKISFRHPHTPANTLITVHCQVKAGKSFARSPSTLAQTPPRKLQNIDSDTISALSAGTGPALLLWVPPKPSSRIYWHIFAANRKPKGAIELPPENHINPSLRFDLAKHHTFIRSSKEKLKRLDLAKETTEAATLACARKAYAALKNESWTNPLTGRLELTRLAWRHVTRKSRGKSRRILSLRVLPLLKNFIAEIPSRFRVVNSSFAITPVTTYLTRDLIFRYTGLIRDNSKSKDLLLRIQERIEYPTQWWKYPLSGTAIKQSAKLVSWWVKT